MTARQVPRFVRPRTILYAAMLGLVIAVMLGAWLLRETTTLAVIRDRAPLFVALSDGGVRNGFTLKIANKLCSTDVLTLTLHAGVPLHLLVQDAVAAGPNAWHVTTRADGITQWRALVTLPGGQHLAASIPVTFRLTDPAGRMVMQARSVFLGPGG